MVSLISDFHTHLSQSFAALEASPERGLQTLMGEAGNLSCLLARVEEGVKTNSSPGDVDSLTALTSTVLDPPTKGSLIEYCYSSMDWKHRLSS
jgi:hypothetical protein